VSEAYDGLVRVARKLAARGGSGAAPWARLWRDLEVRSPVDPVGGTTGARATWAAPARARRVLERPGRWTGGEARRVGWVLAEVAGVGEVARPKVPAAEGDRALVGGSGAGRDGMNIPGAKSISGLSGGPTSLGRRLV
jgi:hypothetical protein